MHRLIKIIKQKKELTDIPDSFVREILLKYLNRKSIALPKKEKELKLIAKEVRAELRRYTGQYQFKSYKKRLNLLRQNKIHEILETHRSTKERASFYPRLKEIIAEIKPKSILDIACGINPIGIASQGIDYYAYDIKKEDLSLVHAFFKKNKINGRVYLKDIRKINSFPKTDLTLILKFLDIIEEDKYNFSKSLINKIESQNIIVSFSTRTLSGKRMNYPRRLWFEKLIKELDFKFKVILSDNEIFYLVKFE